MSSDHPVNKLPGIDRESDLEGRPSLSSTDILHNSCPDLFMFNFTRDLKRKESKFTDSWDEHADGQTVFYPNLL